MTNAQNNEQQLHSIAVYGFDRLGFDLPVKPLNIDNLGTLEFLGFGQDFEPENYDGIIIPQGIFENIQYIRSNLAQVHTYTMEMLDVEQKVVKFYKSGKWVCFLAGEIIDQIFQICMYVSIDDTDLCKRILNSFKIGRKSIYGSSLLDAKDPVFDEYLKTYGYLRTAFILPEVTSSTIKPLFQSPEGILGFEIEGLVFFLPFHEEAKDARSLERIAVLVTCSILEYSSKYDRTAPGWVKKSFHFLKEKELLGQLEQLEKTAGELQSQIESYESYKSVLTQQGNTLINSVFRILTEFFELSVATSDTGIEDACILDENKYILAFLQVRSVNGNIEQEHIARVDEQRTLNGLPSNVPGVLIISNNMSVPSLEGRAECAPSAELIEYAQSSNILIVRVIDLLFLMRHLENIDEKKEMVLNLFYSGYGWLRSSL